MLEDLAAEMKAEQDRNEKISFSAVQSYGVNPDQHAGNVKLARKAGLPSALMPELNEDARLRVLLDQIDAAPPAVTRFVSDPENLKISHDDIENMTALERSFDVLKKAGRSLASVPWRASSNISGVLQGMGEIDDAISRPLKNLWQRVSGIEQPDEGALTRYAKSIRTGGKATAEAIKGDMSGAGIIERGFYSGLESLGQNLLTLPLTIMTGSATPMLTSMTAMSGGEGYGTARDKGKGVVQSLIYGGNQAGIEYLTEVAPALVLVKNLKAKSGLMKFGRDMLAAEIPNEQYATALQDLNEWAVLNPEKPFVDYVAERPAAAVETLIATIVGTGGMVVTAKGLEKVGASMEKYQAATDNRDFLLALGDGVKASKLRERMPEKMQELIKSMKEEHGTPEHAYVSANKLTELWQSAGFDPEVKAAEMFGDTASYLEALATGSEMAIPLEEFAAKFTGEDYYRTLLEDVRLGIGSATMREAQEFENTGKDQALQELIEEADGLAPTQSDVKVYEDVVGQLLGTGMERQTAERNALVMKSVFRTLAARTGLDALELFKEYGLKITRPLPDVLAKRLSVDLSIDPLLDRLRANDIPKDSQVRGKSITEFFSEKGLKDAGGELKALDLDKGKAKKLIRKDGVEMARALIAAKEQGFLPEDADIRDMLDAISNDVAGRGVYSNQVLDERLLNDQMALQQMKEFLDSRDIDVQGMTNEEIKAALQAANDQFADDGNMMNQEGNKYNDSNKIIARPIADVGLKYGDKLPENVWLHGSHSTKGDIDNFSVASNNKGTLFLTRDWETAYNYATKGDKTEDDVQYYIKAITLNPKAKIFDLSSTEDRNNLSEIIIDNTEWEVSADDLEKMNFDEMGLSDNTDIGNALYDANVHAVLDTFNNADIMDDVALQTYNPQNPDILFQSAFHGSPHTFDKFSLSAIGTGEGAQAYGYGLYFAGNKEVAEYYRDALTGPKSIYEVNGKEVFRGSPDDTPYQMAIYDIAVNGYDDAVATGKAWKEQGLDPVFVKEFIKEVKKLKGKVTVQQEKKGQLYKVELAPSDDEYLLWDKPLSEQSEKVKAALQPVIDFIVYGGGGKNLVGDEMDNLMSTMTGNRLYNGDEIWKSLDDAGAMAFDGDKSVSEYLHSLGIRGIKYLDGTSRGKGEGNYNYVIFSDDDVTITEMYQKQADQKRAFIRFGADRQFNIGFLENADLSSFIHETGHFYFEVMADLVGREEAPQQLREDFQTLLDYVGAVDYADVQPEQHETIARSFEAYLMEGKAPSVELQSVFSRMKAWLVQVYKEIRKLNVKLNDDVRGVFDRLVASDEEIEAARTRQGLKEVFATAEDMGVTEAEFQIYRKQGEKVHAAQIEKLEREYLAELTRLQQQWWNEGLDKISKEVDAETQEYPVYVAVQVLTKGATFDGQEMPLKLDRKTLEKQFGKSVVKRLPKGIFTKENGLSADQVAEMVGFESGTEMIEAMATAPARKEYIKAEADRRMRAQHGDLLTDGSAADAATFAVHTDEQAKVLHEELRAMRKLQTTAEKITRAKDADTRAEKKATIGAIPPAEFFKDLARDMIAKKTIEELMPHRYQQAEAKAAREAFEAAGKKKWAEASEAKQRQILNHYLYREASSIKKMVDKQVGKWNDLIKKSDKRLAALRDMNIVTAARAVLAQYGIGDSPDKAMAALGLVQQYDPNLYDSLQMAVDVATQEPKPWKSLQLTEFIGLMDAVNNLWHLSRRSKIAMIDGLAVGLDEINDELHLQIGGRKRPFAGMGKTSAVTDLQQFKIGFLGMGAALRRVEHWVVEMDRGDSGPFHNYILRPIFNAVTKYKTEKKPVIEKLRDIFKRLDSDTFADKKIPAPELTYTFKNKGELLHAILHTGNESNLQKMLVGREWADNNNEQRALDRSQWDRFIQRMYDEQILTEADYVFAQEVWDLLESLKADAQTAHHDMYGYYFAEITAEPVVTPFGTFRGGYVPAITDPYMVKSAAERADQENLLQDNASSMFPATTGKGFTMSRAAGYNKPLLLDLGLLATHVDKVLRFAHMGPAIQDVGRIIGNTELGETFAEINPGWSSEMLVPWLKRTARQTVETKSSGWGGKFADAFFRGLRRRTGLQLMAANVANAAQQLTGLFPAMAKVSPRRIGSALFQLTRSPMELTSQITDKSPWMRDRLDNEISQISGELHSILIQSKYEKAQDFGMRAGYWLSGTAQHVVDVITWQAAYDEKINEGQDERESVQYADSIVRQTQGSFASEDASSFEAKSPFVRLFTQFYSYFNMISNLSVTEGKNAVAELGWKGGSPRLFYIYLMAFALPSFIADMIMKGMRGKLDDDDDGEYIDDVLMSFFYGQARAATALIPGAGQVINATIGKFTRTPQDDRMSVSPAVGSIEGSAGVVKDFYDVIIDGKELKRAHVRDVFTMLGMATGLPFAAAARPLGYVVAAESGATEPANSVDYIRGLMTGYAPR